MFSSIILLQNSIFIHFQYEKDPEIQGCLNQMIEYMREKMSVFDLGSVLIKPVQRILKYPLLLNELLKVCNSKFINSSSASNR